MFPRSYVRVACEVLLPEGRGWRFEKREGTGRVLKQSRRVGMGEYLRPTEVSGEWF